MKNALISVIKFTVPLAFGVFLIWYVHNGLGHEEKRQLYGSFRNADYFWILLSVLFGIFSHLSRAYRWKFTMEPLGLKPRFWNSFFAVMIGYMANFLFPRLGEASRPGVLTKYEKMPFDKLFGTVIAERVADLTILTTIICAVVISELNVLKNALSALLASGEEKYPITAIVTGVLVFLFIVIIFLIILKKSSNPFMLRIKKPISGFFTGLRAIIRMKNSWKFIFHTFFIWGMYILMFYICFFSLPETANTPVMGMLAAFVMGGLSIVFIQGGIGVYPAAVMATLALYGIEEPVGLALGWIIWTAQTLMIIFLGCLSLILLPIYNKKGFMKHIDAIKSKLFTLNSLLQSVKAWKNEGKKIVFTNGCFDLLHLGHIDYLAKAADMGDILIAGVNTDNSVKELKGKGRPVNDEHSRAMLLASLSFIDAVILFDDRTPYNLIKAIEPDILVKGSDYKTEEIAGHELVQAKGGKVLTIDLLEGYSTTLTENKILKIKL